MTAAKQKIAVITGGTRGLGLATARRFAANGYATVLGYRGDEENAQAAVEEISSLGAPAVAAGADLSTPDGIRDLFAAVDKVEGELGVYIHNAAATAFKPLSGIAGHHVDRTMNLTVKSFILGVQAAAARMPGGGAVVAVSGMDTLKVVPRHGLLAAAKAALEQLTTYFAHELAAQQIRVNGVNPGFLETESTRRYLGEHFDQVAKAYARAVPLERSARLDEVAAIIEFLCGPDASWLVGQTIIADGGFAIALTVVPD